MKNSQSNSTPGSSYKQLKVQLELAVAMFDEGAYTIDEYGTILHELKQDFLRLDREKRSRP